MTVRLGLTIAERELVYGRNRRKRIIVRLGMPRKERPPRRRRKEELPVWACPFQISGVGRSRVERALGLDSVQALQVAIQAIRIHLERDAKGATWAGGEQGDPGFPQAVPAFGLAFDRRMRRIIAREEKSFVQEVLRKRRAASRKATAGTGTSRKRRPLSGSKRSAP